MDLWGRWDMNLFQRHARPVEAVRGRSALPFPAKPLGRDDAIATHCRSLRDHAKKLVEEYESGSVREARRRELIEELTEVGREWNAADCQQALRTDPSQVPEAG